MDEHGQRRQWLAKYQPYVNASFYSSYGNPQDLTYTYDAVNRPTAAADADVASYSATFTVDANGNITQIEEAEGPTSGILGQSKVFTYFTMDALNRVTETKTKRYIAGGTNDWRLHPVLFPLP